jgi:hypothetical protein
VKRTGTAALLLALYAALQCRETTFGEVLEMSAACGIDGRQVLANHFTQPLVIPGSLEA